MIQSTKEGPVFELLFLQYQGLSRQILVEDRLFFALFILLSVFVAVFHTADGIFFLSFGLLIISSTAAFLTRHNLLRRRLRHLEQAIVNLDHSMLDYYVKSMSFRYYEDRFLKIADVYARGLLPAVAGTLLMIRYLNETGILNVG